MRKLKTSIYHRQRVKTYGAALLCAMALTAAFPLPTVAANSVASTTVEQQKKAKITGIVTDSNREPLIGVNITVVGSKGTIRAITDIDGMFTIMVPEGRQQLEFTYIGYKNQTIAVNGSKILDVQMDENTNELTDEIGRAHV